MPQKSGSTPARVGAGPVTRTALASTLVVAASTFVATTASAGHGGPPVYWTPPPPPWAAPWHGHARSAPPPWRQPQRATVAGAGAQATVDAAAASAVVVASASPDPGDVERYAAEARTIVKAYATDLQKALGGAIADGGLVEAVDVCHSEAPEIAAALGAERGWSVARTSLKRRNAANSPDEWEREVMQTFEARKDAGEPISGLEHAAVVDDGASGEPVFRFMKAIPTQGVCLGCHAGDTVSAEVEAAIRRFYPDDQARGFAEGDIRGAFTLRKRLSDTGAG